MWAIAAALLVAAVLEAQHLLAAPDPSLRPLVRAWLLPLLVAFFLLVGLSGRVKTYEAAVAGGREGLDVAVRIVPFLVVILGAVAMFRASGALDLLIGVLSPRDDGDRDPGRGAADGPAATAVGIRRVRRDERDPEDPGSRTPSWACW